MDNISPIAVQNLEMQPIYLALIALVGILVPLISSFMTAWLVNKHTQRAKQLDYEIQAKIKEDDYARQDLVAKRLAEALERAEHTTREQTSLMLLSNAQVVESSLRNGQKLDVLKVQGDGHMTALIQSELNMTKVALRSLRNGIARDKLAKIPTDEDTLIELKATEMRAMELQKALSAKRGVDTLTQTMPGGTHIGEGK